MRKIIVLFCLIPQISLAQFGPGDGTTKGIDKIINQSKSDILLAPNDKVDIEYFTGEKVVQSTADGELEESSVTNAELGNLTGSTENIQTGLDAKALKTTEIQVTAPITGAGDLSANRTIGITQANTTTDGYLSSIDWNIFNNKQPAGNYVETTGDQTVSGIKTFDTQFVAVSTTNGFRPCPVMTNLERDAILSPGEGDCVVSSDDNELNYYLGGAWGQVGGGSELTAKGNLIGFGTSTQECVLNKIDGNLLTVDSTAPCGFEFKVPPISVPTTLKGEISGHNGTNPVAIPAPTQSGQFLESDDSEDSGWKVSNSILANIGQAQFVGKLDLSNDCQWSRDSASYGIMLDGADCSATSVTGNVSLNSNPLQAGVRIPNFRTDGFYRVEYQGLVYNASNLSLCRFSVSKTGNYEGNGDVWINVTGSGSREQSHLTGNIKFNQGDSGEIYFISKSNVGNTCTIYGNSSDQGAISVHFYPDNSSLAAVQNTELTAQTANDFSAKIAGNDVIVSSNYDWIDTVTSATLGNYQITVKNNIGVTQSLSCVAVPNTGTRTRITPVETVSALVYNITASNQSAGAVDTAFEIHCSKQGVDVNKSQVVAGNFEQIEEKTVEYNAENSPINSVFITGGSTPTILADNYKMADGTTPWISCTRPSTGNFNCTFATGLYTVTPTCNISQNHPSTIQMGVNIESQSNTVLNFETYDGNTPFNVTAINIVCVKSGADAVQDLKAVVINNLETTKRCQRKGLSGNVSTTGAIAELQFNNIDPLKKYSVATKFIVNDGSGSVENNFLFINVGGFDTGLDAYAQAGSLGLMLDTLTVNAQYLTPVSSVATVNITAINGGVFLDANSWLEICELGDNVISTTKFD